MLVERNIKYLNPEDIEIFSTSYLPNIVMKLDLVGSISYLDFGTILYRNHSVVSRKTHAALVEESSLFIELIEPLHEYFLDMLKKYSHATIKHYFKVTRNVIKDLYSIYENINLTEKNLALNLYQEYTQFLMIDRSTKLKKSIADMGNYNRKQNVLAEILSRALNTNIQEIKNSYIEISSKHKSHNQPVVENEIKKYENKNIKFIGPVNSIELNQFYRKSDVCIVPSLIDDHPATITEALYCGLPIITTQGCGSKTLIKDGENGFIVPIADSEAIAQKIQWFIDNQDKIGEMSSKAKQSIEDIENSDQNEILANHIMKVIEKLKNEKGLE